MLFILNFVKYFPYTATFGGIRVEVSLRIESILWNLRPRRSSLTAHVPEILCICSFPREPSRKTNDCNRGWAANARGFPGKCIYLMMILRTVDGSHTGSLRGLEGSRFRITAFQYSCSWMQRILRISMMLVVFENPTMGQVTKYLHARMGMFKCMSSTLGRSLLATRGDVRRGPTVLISNKIIHISF